MKFKHVFLAATAALMVPGFAMASQFTAEVDFINGDEATVTATLTCNSGNPQVQTAEISNDVEHTWLITLADNSDCTVSIDDVDGYTASASCEFLDIDEETIETCLFEMIPDSFTFTVNKVWDFGDPDYTGVSTDVKIEWGCDGSALAETDVAFGLNDGDVWLTGVTDDFEIVLYADPDGGATCSASEVIIDSAVDSDQGCDGGIDFAIGEEKECTITNTVFVEGIPTLNQYGMAIMVLLMLGVGFVGFRRFV